MQPLTGLWGCGDIALIYYRYGSPNGLLWNENALIATDMEALTGFCGMETLSLLQIWKP